MDFTTFYRGKEKEVMVRCGCFNGPMGEFLEKVKKTHGDGKYARAYQAAAETAEVQIGMQDAGGAGSIKNAERSM